MTVQPPSSRVTRTVRVTPLTVVLLDDVAWAVPMPDVLDDADTVLCEDDVPACAFVLPFALLLALEPMLPSSSIIVVSTRPSAKW
ncbi:hypothetical protein [Sphingomonas dokdonensis]|uniref:Uncharacterized protein n=1 Tax=Sphingomonas dokdonensis TaxID=344880 RepID=A0A245ZEG8_9SPHN|nr:hypothetical protein [Sphingomonas dokdonensis]OWK28113.1 hypothetical protein SPDO_29460 [Sphingomonas dokdonensis]